MLQMQKWKSTTQTFNAVEWLKDTQTKKPQKVHGGQVRTPVLSRQSCSGVIVLRYITHFLISIEFLVSVSTCPHSLVYHQSFCKHYKPTIIAMFVDVDDQQMDPSDTKEYTVRANRSTNLARERVSCNPVFLDPLTSRRLVVLARSWSCQPSISGRSVFNLQKQALPEYRERIKELEEVRELPVLLPLYLREHFCVSECVSEY